MKYLWHAFKNSLNLTYLLGGFAASLFIPFPHFWAAFLGIEALILAMFAGNKRFRMVVDSQLASERSAYVLQRQRNAIKVSHSKNRNRLRDIEVTVRQIKQNYRQKQHGGMTGEMVENSLESVEKLEKEYIRYLYSLVKLDELKNKRGDQDLRATISRIESEMGSADGQMKELLNKRLEILNKRLSNKGLNNDNMSLLAAQLDVIEETFKYLLDESLNITDSKVVSSQVDEVLINMETTKGTLQEIESFVDLTDAAMGAQRVRS